MSSLSARRALAVALLAVALTACSIGPDLTDMVNQGARVHATEHVTDGDPAETVMCSIDGDGWLIPSALVVRYGDCDTAFGHAAGTYCDIGVCTVLAGDGRP